jgi:ankyrin repeat protein
VTWGRTRGTLSPSAYGGRLDVNARDAGGKTALHWAAEKGWVAVVEKLASAYGDRLDVNAKDSDGRTALDTARTSRHASVAAVLTSVLGERQGGAPAAPSIPL